MYLEQHKLKKVSHLLKKLIIIIFFSINITIMFVDGFPDRSALGDRIMNFLAQYQAWSMLYQPWAMFAPNPMNTNAFVEAELQFQDGTTEKWPLLRQLLLSNPRRVLVGDRYRILAQETLLPNSNELVWFDVSKYIARQVIEKESLGKNRTIKKIVFNRYSNVVVPPPQAPLIPHGTLSSSYQSEFVFYYIPTEENTSYAAKNNN